MKKVSPVRKAFESKLDLFLAEFELQQGSVPVTLEDICTVFEHFVLEKIGYSHDLRG